MLHKLADNFEFPVRTLETINGYLTIFSGPGTTLRMETESWKIVLDVMRQGALIYDIVAITLISKSAQSSDSCAGWVITRSCRLHSTNNDDDDVNSNTSGAAGIRDVTTDFNDPGSCSILQPRWIKINEGGRNAINCCTMECDGPFKKNKWKIFDTTRMQVVSQVLGQEVVALRQVKNNAEIELAGVREHNKKLLARAGELMRENREADNRRKEQSQELQERKRTMGLRAMVLNQTVANLKEQLAAAQHKNTAETAMLKDKLAAMELKNVAETAALRTTLADMEQKAMVLSQSEAKKERAINTLNSQVDKKEGEIRRLDFQLAAKNKEVQSLQAELD